MTEKLIPRLRFSGYTDAWEKRQLGEVGEVATGNTPSTAEVENWTEVGGFVWVTPTDINNLIISDSGRYLTRVGWEKARTVPENSVLITSIASIGKNAINTVPVAFNQQINAIIPKKHEAYFILSSMIRNSKRFASLAGQTATAIINKSTFEKFEIDVPSLTEQTAIGNFFSQLDRAIALQEKKLENLKTTKKTLLKLMFV